MRIHPAIVAIGVLAWGPPATAQAPAAADLWRVATGSLASPAALQDGPSGIFWNPAAGRDAPLAVGAQIVQTSDVVGLSGFLLSASHQLTPGLRIGVVAGRFEMRDLVRTTTSPNSVDGSIPLYEQSVAADVAAGGRTAQIGLAVRVHDARFDRLRDHGVTADVGIRYRPARRLLLAAATHFLSPTLSDEPTTDYYGAAELIVLDRPALAGQPTRLALRYGAALRHTGDLDHTAALGLALNGQFRVDAALTSESAFGQRVWRA
ncbi:MAG: hypothetical protein PVF27_03690, partial [Gemmatimonadales bacterium]